MKRKNKKIILAVVSIALLQSGTNILPVLANNTATSVIESRENISLEQKCTARYNSIRINWNSEADHVYKIETSDFQDGSFSVIAENLNTSEYIHENVGVGQKNTIGLQTKLQIRQQQFLVTIRIQVLKL